MVSEKQTAIISALRTIRLLRLVKLARSNFALKCLIDSIAITITQCGNFIVILMIFIYVFSLLGMELFAGQFRFNQDGTHDIQNGVVPRSNYDEIVWAFITVF
jgi:hypothetical protein